MNIYFAVFGAMVCSFCGGFLAAWLACRQYAARMLAEQAAEFRRKRDVRGRYCK